MAIGFAGRQEDALSEMESDPETRDLAHRIREANERESAASSGPDPVSALSERAGVIRYLIRESEHAENPTYAQALRVLATEIAEGKHRK